MEDDANDPLIECLTFTYENGHWTVDGSDKHITKSGIINFSTGRPPTPTTQTTGYPSPPTTQTTGYPESDMEQAPVAGTYQFHGHAWSKCHTRPVKGEFYVDADGAATNLTFQVGSRVFMAGETADRILRGGQVRELQLRIKLKDAMENGTPEQRAMAQQILDEVYTA